MAELGTQLRIIELFCDCHTLEVGPTQVGAALGINKASASEQLRCLAEAGYLARREGGQYGMGPRLFQVGQVFLVNRLAEIAATAADCERQARSVVDQFCLSAARLAGPQPPIQARPPQAPSLATGTPRPSRPESGAGLGS